MDDPKVEECKIDAGKSTDLRTSMLQEWLIFEGAFDEF